MSGILNMMCVKKCWRKSCELWDWDGRAKSGGHFDSLSTFHLMIPYMVNIVKLIRTMFTPVVLRPK